MLGPLGEIAAVLAIMRSTRLLVLAVDLPMMTGAFLRRLLVHGAGERQGVVPRTANGFFEPLAAVYPQTGLSVALARLGRRELSLQPFVRELMAAQQMAAVPFAASEAVLFSNWNAPEDLPR